MKALTAAFLAIGIVSWGSALAAGPAKPAQSLAGDWDGVLSAGPADLHLAFHFVETAGALSGTLTSVDQGNMAMPFDSVHRDGATVSAGIEVIHGVFQGVLSADGKTLAGTWSQGQPRPLSLTRRAGQ